MKASEDKAAFAKAQKQYTDMMAAGKGVKAALEATGLSHSQGDWAWYGDPRNPDHVEPGSIALPDLPGKDEPGYEVALRQRGVIVGSARKGEHPKYQGRELSWGQIAVAANIPEGAIRRAFTALGIDSAGTRKGHGGRWLGDEPRLYLGNRKGIGLEHAQPRRVDPASLVKTNDTVKSTIPSRLEALRGEMGARVAKKRTAKKRPAPKAAPKAQAS